MLGVDKPTSKLDIASMDVLNGGGKTLTGSIFGGLKAKSDVSTLVKWYLNKVIPHLKLLPSKHNLCILLCFIHHFRPFE